MAERAEELLCFSLVERSRLVRVKAVEDAAGLVSILLLLLVEYAAADQVERTEDESHEHATCAEQVRRGGVLVLLVRKTLVGFARLAVEYRRGVDCHGQDEKDIDKPGYLEMIDKPYVGGLQADQDD